jgi:tetratricopeptide (TPR) repeat protein
MFFMQKNQYITMAAIIVMALVAVAVFVFVTANHPHQGASAISTSSSLGQTYTVTDASATSTSAPGYSITVRHTIVPTAPDLQTPLVFSASVSADKRVAIAASATVQRAALAKDPYDFNALIGLALVYQGAGDYSKSNEILKYASVLYPHNTVSYVNLANLNDQYLKNYSVAEGFYLMAIANQSTNVSLYQDLAEMYQYRYMAKARQIPAILRQGIAANPTAINLEVSLARYYKSIGRLSDANAEYDAAIANARGQGQASLVTQIQQEKAVQ